MSEIEILVAQLIATVLLKERKQFDLDGLKTVKQCREEIYEYVKRIQK